MKIKQFVALLAAAYFVCIANTVHAQQTSELELANDTLVVGVRQTAIPVRKFCEEFISTLQNQLSDEGITVDPQPVKNEYLNAQAIRYGGLIDGNVQAECGPNSVSSETLTEPRSGQRYSEFIQFSNRFYTTNIKLLLRQELAQELSNADTEEALQQRLSELRVGVLEDTTTIKQLKQSESIYSNVREFVTESISTPSSFDQALDALDSDDIQAFASDAVILESFLKDGVKKQTPEDASDKALSRKQRSPYIDRGFAIFPSGNSTLPGLDNEYYAIAVSKSPLGSQVRQEVNAALAKIDQENTTLSQAVRCIDIYQTKSLSQYEDSCAQLEPKIVPSPDPVPPNFLWFVFVGCLVLMALGFFLFRSRFSGQVRSPLGTFTVEGVNENSPEYGIDAINIKSREGSFAAEDNAGGNIRARKLDAKGDIDLTRNPPPQKHKTKLAESSNNSDIKSAQDRNSEVDIMDIRELNAGGNVTIAQISQDLGVSRFKHDRYHDIYTGIWASLLNLRLSAEDLIENVSKEEAVKFSSRLRETKRIIRKEKFYFDETDFRYLMSVLSDLGDARFAGKRAVDIRSMSDLKKQIILTSNSHNEKISSEEIERFEDFLFEYENVIEKLRAFFKQKLST